MNDKMAEAIYNMAQISKEKCRLCIEYDFGREEDWCHECCMDEDCTKEHSDFAD